jgi:hypothetical protein
MGRNEQMAGRGGGGGELVQSIISFILLAFAVIFTE